MECGGFFVYCSLEGLASGGIIRFPFGPVNLFLARLSVGLLPAALVMGVIGIVLDKERMLAAVSVLAVLPIFILMMMFSGYW
jgi:hypothetical protein